MIKIAYVEGLSTICELVYLRMTDLQMNDDGPSRGHRFSRNPSTSPKDAAECVDGPTNYDDDSHDAERGHDMIVEVAMNSH